MAKGLGKGIQAFFPEVNTFDDQEQVQEVSLKELRPNPYQPRKTFTEESINDLKESIINHGILQPLLVRKSIKGFEIVVGERRYRAASEAGLEKVPVIIKDLNEDEMMEFALIENLQREDLNPIDEAVAYDKLMKHLKVTQEQLSKRLGKSRPHIANHLRLLQLPQAIQQMIENGQLSMGHGRALLGLKNKEKMQAVLNKVIEENLNVRQLEQLIQRVNENVPRETFRKKEEPSLYIREKESSLRDRFGTSVKIKKNKKRGKIEIQFFSEDDLDRIISMLETY